MESVHLPKLEFDLWSEIGVHLEETARESGIAQAATVSVETQFAQQLACISEHVARRKLV
jgi:hypothetical protein